MRDDLTRVTISQALFDKLNKNGDDEVILVTEEGQAIYAFITSVKLGGSCGVPSEAPTESNEPQTLRDYMRAEYPDRVSEEYDGGVRGCPRELIDKPVYPEVGDLSSCYNRNCTDCWDRKIKIKIERRSL